MLQDMHTSAATLIAPRDIALPSGRYFGPCAGNDLPLAFKIGGDRLGHFLFCDVSYTRGPQDIRVARSATNAVPRGWTRLSRHVGGDHAAPIRHDDFYRRGAVRPSSAIEIWQRPDASICTVELRCDLAQDALTDLFGPRSIALFLHFKDGTGEGGSNLWFLADRSEHNDIQWQGLGLLDDLAPRLAEGAVVITDGLLADEGFQSGTPFTLCGIDWEPLGTIGPTGRSNRKAMVWRVLHCAD